MFKVVLKCLLLNEKYEYLGPFVYPLPLKNSPGFFFLFFISVLLCKI